MEDRISRLEQAEVELERVEQQRDQLAEALRWAMKFVDQVRIENPAPKGGGEDIAYEEAMQALNQLEESK